MALRFFRPSKGIAAVEYGLIAAVVVLVLAGAMLQPDLLRQLFAGTVNSANGSQIPSMGTSTLNGGGSGFEGVGDDEVGDPSNNNGGTSGGGSPTELCAILSIACGNNDMAEVAAGLGSEELVQMFNAITLLMDQMDLPPESAPLLSEVVTLANMGHTIAGGIAEIEALCPNNQCVGMSAVTGHNVFENHVDTVFSDGDPSTPDSEALTVFMNQFLTVAEMYSYPEDYGLPAPPIPQEYQNLFMEIITIATYNIEQIVLALGSELSYDGTTVDLGGAASMSVTLNANVICGTSGSVSCYF